MTELGSIATVVDSDARLRDGPPDFRWRHPERIPRYARVRILEESGKHVRVEGLRGKRLGWTVASNLGSYFKDSEEGDLAPHVPVAVPSGWSIEKKALGKTYNRLGGLLERVSGVTRSEPNAALAVWHVESGGSAHAPGRATIRFENHLLFRRWGDRHREPYDRYFRHGGHNGIPGRPWQKHQFRESAPGVWESVHGSQDSNYRTLRLARSLAGDDAALQCISLGGPQILVSHYLLLGYRSPSSMYSAFQESERSHVLGFFDYCRYVRPGEELLEALRKREWAEFAAGYNGPGNVTTYSALIGAAYDLARAVIPAP